MRSGAKGGGKGRGQRAGAERDDVVYCPICGRNIFASNVDEVKTGGHNHYVFIHDEIAHTRDEVAALQYGIN